VAYLEPNLTQSVHTASPRTVAWVMAVHSKLRTVLSHPVFRRILNANYMCVQDVHTTHIATKIENIKNNALLYLKHSYNKTYNYYKSIVETILNLLFGAPYSTETVD
jgi:hypothetical protein